MDSYPINLHLTKAEIMTTPTNSPSERTWTLREAVELLNKLLTDRRNKWQKAKFCKADKSEAWKRLNTQLQANKHRWGWSGFIKFLWNYKADIENIMPGKKSRSQRIKSEVEDLLFGIEQYASQHPEILQ